MLRILSKPKLMGPAVVAGLGTLAGGAAANALMPKKNAPPGGGIPGLTSSTGSGKDGTGPGYAIQVDPSTALNYFSQASSTFASGYNQGLSYYGPALDKAATQLKIGYGTANDTLKQLSYSSGQALNEEMRMLGLDPLQATATYGNALRNGYQDVQSQLPFASDYVDTLSGLMDTATQTRDLEKRAAAKDKLNSYVASGKQSILDDLNIQLAKSKLNKPSADQYNWQALESEAWTAGMTFDTSINPITGHASYSRAPAMIPFEQKWGFSPDDVLDANAKVPYMGYADSSITDDFILRGYEYALNKWQKGVDEAQGNIDNFNKYYSNITGLVDQFNNDYAPNYDAGYTPDQVSNKVTQLPGYQFQLEQGTQAVERQGASKGMLGSANTQLAEQKYGQGLAQNYYQQYLGYLSGVAAQGEPATAQISANQATLGTNLATLAQNYGQAQMDTARQIANFQANQLMQSGILFNQTAMFNAQQQNASIMQGKNAQTQLASQAIQSGPAYQNAATNYGQLQLAQNMNYGNAAGYLNGGGGGGGGTYTTPWGGTFTDYTGMGWH